MPSRGYRTKRNAAEIHVYISKIQRASEPLNVEINFSKEKEGRNGKIGKRISAIIQECYALNTCIFSVLRQLGVPLNPPAGHFSRLSISVALPIHPYKYCMICVISQIYFRLFHSKSTNFMKLVFGTNENWGFHAGHTLRLCLLTTLSLLSESRSYILRNLSNAHYPMGSQGFELSPAE